jgi:hypothetical protein
LERSLTILTLEIGGEPVACVHADAGLSHHQIIHQAWLHRDLVTHVRGGTPLWDGSAAVTLRPATEGEGDLVAERFAAHHLAHDPHDEGEFIVFLVPVERAVREDGDDDFPI